MPRWYPTLFHELGGKTIGCPNCNLHWGGMAFVSPIETDYLSIEKAMSAKVKCRCKEYLIKDLQEFEPDGWNKIKQWWEKELHMELRNCQVPKKKNVEEFLREQRDNNLRTIFG